jgi:hypothetical protein
MSRYLKSVIADKSTASKKNGIRSHYSFRVDLGANLNVILRIIILALEKFGQNK